MYSFALPMREEDKQDFEDMKWALKKKLSLYLDITNGLVDNFNVSNPFKNTLEIGFLYVNYSDDLQTIFIDTSLPASNVAIDILDSIIELGEEEYKKNVDIKYIFDPDINDVKTILVLRVGSYGYLLEDLYSLYFTGSTIRKYGFDETGYETSGEFVPTRLVKTKMSWVKRFSSKLNKQFSRKKNTDD